MPKKLFLFLFFPYIIFSQTLTGKVLDQSTLKPLESANIIAKPLQQKASLKFAIADNLGRYKLELENGIEYEVSVSYISYKEEIFVIQPNSTITNHDFKLVPTGETLKEVIIKHEYKPIDIKKDTLTYDIKAFANGNERKMKEVLEKLPGVEVDKKGNVTVQGKKVTKMLVEGKSFFGGGSKLAVENIPANALDKIEVIDHFNEVGFMKQVSDSEDLAMNVKLKSDKKKFVFGDLEAAAEVANTTGYHLAHAALFYYTPKNNISFIGDINNVGRSTFTFEDLLRFDGGISSFISGRKSLTNLFSFTNDNTDVVQNKSQFGALNYSFTAHKKITISGYSIFSKILLNAFQESNNQYLQSSFSSFENKTLNNSSKSILGITNIKFDFNFSKTSRVFYNIQFQASNNNTDNLLKSVTNTLNTNFQTLSKADNISFKDYFEWHKSYNDNHNTTFVINHAYQKTKPQNHWFTDQPFLSGVIPIVSDAFYVINQTKEIQNHSVDILGKHYWIVNNKNHIYSVFGNNFENTLFSTQEQQVLSTNLVNNFDGFGNRLHYQLNDFYVGLEYKFKLGKWINKPAIYFHKYHLITQQINNNTITKNFWQPQFTSEYEFNKSEKIQFDYKLINSFAEASAYAENYTLQSYNLVYKGNAMLQNEQYHNASLYYNKMNMFRGILMNAYLYFNKKEQTLRNQVVLSGINQINTPVVTNNPETSWRLLTDVSKKIYRFTCKLKTSLSWYNYIQTTNNANFSTNRNNQSIGASVKTAHKKWPDFMLGYTKNFTQLSGLSTSRFSSNEFRAETEITFFKNLIFKVNYVSLSNFENSKSINFFQVTDCSLRYQKKNNPFTFELSVNNVFDTKQKNNYSFSDYIISQQTTYILPRIVLLSLSYKL
ncbi:outer membrane receptor protein involved in Fe transport [Flavobacterium croceum DSM 17960]|uniref:Outer membrane receptor protein involved in Fe transport n=1 Tax=Flavobacterium croceum DSM 17960 TaxID=1121886 RepID=A0A2S4N6Q1_9FLAO|nr:carboxypeptidase-like regulatory domain-containing protein [Flavobacterium croceum]POS01395.1 outer membrane receptor protein involved in Fe transport [Flavobacterium croceum DSM 17960]